MIRRSEICRQGSAALAQIGRFLSAGRGREEGSNPLFGSDDVSIKGSAGSLNARNVVSRLGLSGMRIFTLGTYLLAYGLGTPVLSHAASKTPELIGGHTEQSLSTTSSPIGGGLEATTERKQINDTYSPGHAFTRHFVDVTNTDVDAATLARVAASQGGGMQSINFKPVHHVNSEQFTMASGAAISDDGNGHVTVTVPDGPQKVWENSHLTSDKDGTNFTIHQPGLDTTVYVNGDVRLEGTSKRPGDKNHVIEIPAGSAVAYVRPQGDGQGPGKAYQMTQNGATLIFTSSDDAPIVLVSPVRISDCQPPPPGKKGVKEKVGQGVQTANQGLHSAGRCLHITH